MILSVGAIISATYTFLLANCKGCILRNVGIIPTSYGGSEQADKVIDLFFHVADLRSSKIYSVCPRTLNYGKSPYSVHALLVHKRSLTLQSPSFFLIHFKFILFLTGRVPPYMIQNYMTTFTTDTCMVCVKENHSMYSFPYTCLYMYVYT